MGIWEAIQTLGNTTAGDPFVYDETCGYDHIRGDLGRDLDRLLTASKYLSNLWPDDLVFVGSCILFHNDLAVQCMAADNDLLPTCESRDHPVCRTTQGVQTRSLAFVR